jgi:chromosome segregation ATPase
VQGEKLAQADLSRQRSLSAALDQAAGGATGGEREESLFENVHAEFLKYFTETGKPRKELTEAQSSATAAEDRVRELSARLAAIEKDVERAAFLQREIQRLQVEERGLEDARKKHDARLAAVEGLERELATLRAQHEAARNKEELAAKDEASRKKLIEALQAARQEHARLAAAVESSAPAKAAAKDDEARAAAAAAECRGQHEQAKKLRDQAQIDEDLLQALFDLETLSERRVRLEAAEAKLRAADEALAALCSKGSRRRSSPSRRRAPGATRRARASRSRRSATSLWISAVRRGPFVGVIVTASRWATLSSLRFRASLGSAFAREPAPRRSSKRVAGRRTHWPGSAPTRE